MNANFCVSLSSWKGGQDDDPGLFSDSTALKVCCNPPYESRKENCVCISFKSRRILHEREDVPMASHLDALSFSRGVLQKTHSDFKSPSGPLPSSSFATLVFSSDEREGIVAEQRWENLFTQLRSICSNQPSLLSQARNEWVCSSKASAASSNGEVLNITSSYLEGGCKVPPRFLGTARLQYACAVRDTIFSALCSNAPVKPPGQRGVPGSRSLFWKCCEGANQESPSSKSPSASNRPFSFSLVYYSQAFGLLFFCRDTIGLAPLLFGTFPILGRACDVLIPEVSVATSARDMRLLGQLDVRQGGSVSHQLTEVPVSGVWVVDLWAWCRLNYSHRVWEQNSSLPPGNSCELGLHKDVTGCILWKEQSPLLDAHTWCQCQRCKASRESYWSRNKNGSFVCDFCPANSVADTLLCRCEPRIICTLCKKLASAVRRSIPETLRSMHSLFCKSKCTDSLGWSRELSTPTSVSESEQCVQASRNKSDDGTLFVGVLFSGGVDSTLLAASLVLELARCMRLSSGYPDSSDYTEIGSSVPSSARCQGSGSSTIGRVVVELITVGFSTEAPDRLTALRSFEDILELLECLGGKHTDKTSSIEPNGLFKTEEMLRDVESKQVAKIGRWELEVRLVAIDVDAASVEAERANILEAIAPQKSHMDFNIATPLYFALRGRGYLVSPHFGKRPEWLQLRNCARLWQPIIIGKRFSRGGKEGPSRDEEDVMPSIADHLKCEGDAAALNLGEAIEISAESFDEKYRCAVCQRKSKRGCVHRACKLCCGKLCRLGSESSALMGNPERSTRDGSAEFPATIHIANLGHIPVHSLGVKVFAECAAHRIGITSSGPLQPEPVDDTSVVSKPFASLLNAPCGIDLVEKNGCRPFYALENDGLGHRAANDTPMDTDYHADCYIVQSRVLLVGSGADELFGGYGRHRTAKQKRDRDAARSEQLLDIRRLWIRNLGRDGRVASLFGKKTRLPFLDPSLLTFICRHLNFDTILNPIPEADTVMQMVLRKVVLTMDCVKEGKKGTDSDGALPVELANDVTLSDGCESMAEFRKEETEDLIRNVGTSALANGENVQFSSAADQQRCLTACTSPATEVREETCLCQLDNLLL